MNIFVTNDDGIRSEGIIRLARAAKNFGNVIVVAPSSQCSAMSHRLTIGKDMLVSKVEFPVEDVVAYEVDGTPADCVKLAKNRVFTEVPDVVLSGINNGYNAGSDIQYSGTIGAALEAACSGIHAIAFSEERYDGDETDKTCHEVTEKYLETLLGELLQKKLEIDEIWNVNFPGCGLDKCSGVLYDVKMAKDAFYTDSYERKNVDKDKMLFRLVGEYHEDAQEGTDFKALVDRYVSVGIVRNITSPE